LAEQDPSNVGWQSDLSVSYERIGDILDSQGKLEDAIGAYRQALKIRESLTEEDPSNAIWQRAWIIVYYKVGSVLTRNAAKLDEGRRLIDKALELPKFYGGNDTDTTRLIQSHSTILEKLDE
jgi:tetratricopeptide (TPR) repeat protein